MGKGQWSALTGPTERGMEPFLREGRGSGWALQMVPEPRSSTLAYIYIQERELPQSKPWEDPEGPVLSGARLENRAPWTPPHPISTWKTFASPLNCGSK